MPKRIALIIHGAAGRMGQALLRLAAQRDDVDIVAALVRAHSDRHGQAVGSAQQTRAQPLLFSATLPDDLCADVMIDFAGATAFDAALQLAVDRRVAFVSGTTGLSPMQHEVMKQASRKIPVLWASNFSLGVAVLARLVKQAARGLPDWDCEILEVHHRRKLDAPSGTALMLGHSVDAARGSADTFVASDRNGTLYTPVWSSNTNWSIV
ncbi:MAG: 4-hydroxy-tetrahydrodipicolinate reductase, partial [Dokdonella sp.]